MDNETEVQRPHAGRRKEMQPSLMRDREGEGSQRPFYWNLNGFYGKVQIKTKILEQ